ncbi:MAG TPA: sulfatase, partial [bacterium]|nr:sulfatase [bacterium]
MKLSSLQKKLLVMITVCCCVILLACHRRPVPNSPNVLLVTFDTVRADHVGCYGDPRGLTPTVDHLASQGIIFRQCTSPAPITLPTHASILTGLYPFHHKVRNNGTYKLMPDVQTLGSILHLAGYDTAAFVSAHVLKAQYGLARGFDVYDDHVAESSTGMTSEIAERAATDTTDAVLKWIAGRSSQRPFFLWVHYFDPHMAYNPPQLWRDRFPDDPYSGEIAYADEQLGRVLEQID